MCWFLPNGTDIHSAVLVDIIKDAERTHSKLPDWRKSLEWRNEIVQQLAMPCRHIRCMSQLGLDRIKPGPPIIRTEVTQVALHSLRK